MAIILTHNREFLLKRCVSKVKENLENKDDLLVIVNGSNDGTVEYLKKSSINHVFQKNKGSAGGWKTGIEMFLKSGKKSVWIMDDDGYPDSNSLSLLKKELKNNTVCVSSALIEEHNEKKFVFPYPRVNKFGIPKLFFKYKCYKDLPIKMNELNFAHLFNGALISRNAIQKIGNVEEGFFIYGDELDYNFRLKKVGIVKTIFKARHFHPPVSMRFDSSLRCYYYLRNSIIIRKKYFFFGQITCILLPIFLCFRILISLGPIKLLKLLFNKYFYMAIWNGMRLKIGKDYGKA